jgi:xanthine dehydrogenase accessory factor
MREETLETLIAAQARKQPVVLATHLESGAERIITAASPDDPLYEKAIAVVRSDKSTLVDSPEGPTFLHVYNPPLRMIVVGAVHIAQPLTQMATLAGYDVTVVDPRGAFLSPERFPDVTVMPEWPDEALEKLNIDHRTAVVTLTHDPKVDDPALHVALRLPAFYIGCLGSNRTHAKRVERLSAEGFTTSEIGRIHGPIGADIGAKSPAEIAVSILAEVTQALRRGDTKALADPDSAGETRSVS